MAIKDKIKANIPQILLPVARTGYRIYRARHYYPHYVFNSGHAKCPTEIRFEITFRCNLRCIMCPLASAFDDPNSQIVQEWKRETELNSDEIKKMISDGAKMGVRKLILTGGEPFLRKDLIDIIKHTKKNKMDCGVLTNGVLIDKKKAELIVGTGLDNLQFSIDGPEEVHNKIRNSSKAFERTINAARAITQAKKKLGTKKPVLSFCCTISAANMEHLVEIVDIAYEVEASISYGYLFYTTDDMMEQTNKELQTGDAKGEDQNVSDELKQINHHNLCEEILRVKEKSKKRGVLATFEPDLKKDEIKRRYMDDSYSFVNKCFYPWYSVRINPYGVVYPCSMNINMGNIRKTPLYNIWNNERYVNFRKALKEKKLFPKCAKCCKLNNKLWDYLPKI